MVISPGKKWSVIWEAAAGMNDLNLHSAQRYKQIPCQTFYQFVLSQEDVFATSAAPGECKDRRQRTPIANRSAACLILPDPA